MTSLRTLRRCAAVTLTVTCALAGVTTPAHAGPAALTKTQRKVLVEATRQFQDVKVALAAGYLATDMCSPGMGYHYLHPGVAADMAVDPVLPEVLLYDRNARLLGVEFFKADADGDLKTATDRPTVFGHPFDGPMLGHEVPAGAPAMPVHYDLHVWLYLPNPAGELAHMNPRVTCP